jgi:hypothetical protein
LCVLVWVGLAGTDLAPPRLPLPPVHDALRVCFLHDIPGRRVGPHPNRTQLRKSTAFRRSRLPHPAVNAHGHSGAGVRVIPCQGVVATMSLCPPSRPHFIRKMNNLSDDIRQNVRGIYFMIWYSDTCFAECT